ncbi:MAG: M23 family metallopeptidase [Chloroflexi bacterium]|nr:M23 family metallopeptidase [Chloroflexota bacterium]
MTNIFSPISPTYGLSSGEVAQPKNAATSTSGIVSSFKEILSVMTATSGMTGMGPSAGLGMSMSDLMAPLMLLLIERLVEQQLEQDSSGNVSAAAQSPFSAGAVTGSQPEPLGRPVTGGRLTQEFHGRHKGLDIGIPVGTPVRTTMDGRVVHAGWNDQGYGNLVIVENGAYRTYYAHLSSIPVSVGDFVKAGVTIGLSGNTGNSTGPHLHYEIRKNRVPIDPTSATLGGG